MQVVYNDGGRAEAGYKGRARDCVVRSVAIVTGLPYQKVYNDLMSIGKNNRKGKKNSSKNGVFTKKQIFKEYMQKLGFKWTSCMGIGTGCKVHLKDGEVPTQGKHVIAVSRHYTALIDGIIYDIFDPQRNGNRCVYGYWTRK